MKKYLSFKQVKIIILIFVALVVADKVTKPFPLAYEEAILNVEESNDTLNINFMDNVSNYRISRDHEDINVIAYRTLSSALLNQKHQKSINMSLDDIKNVYYVEAHPSGEDVLLHGTPVSGVRVMQPHLILSYYFLIAIVCFVISMALRALIEKRAVKQVIHGLIAVSGAYIISNFMMKGFSATTYFITRDAVYIILGTLLMMFPILYALDDQRH